MRFLISSQLSEHRYKTPEGYLVCLDCILARTGSQEYTSDELWQDGKDDVVNIYRPSEEVFSDKTLASFENKPFVNEHPDEDVNPSNYSELAKGFVRDIRKGIYDGQEVMIGNIIVTDPETIEQIENGEKLELSCGYDCDIVKDEKGNYNQVHIKGNHVALCEAGRAGIARIVDSNKVKDNKVKATQIKKGMKIKRNSSFDKSFDTVKDIDEYDDYIVFTMQNGGSTSYYKNDLVEIQDSVKDSLTKEERELCDYMLYNCYGRGESAKDLLRKMEIYYSAYSSLARHKPDDVLEYFEKEIDKGIYDSIKDKVTNQTKRYIEHELKSSIYDTLEQRDIYLKDELELIEEWRELSEEEKEYARQYLKNKIFEGKKVLKKFSDSVKDAVSKQDIGKRVITNKRCKNLPEGHKGVITDFSMGYESYNTDAQYEVKFDNGYKEWLYCYEVNFADSIKDSGYYDFPEEGPFKSKEECEEKARSYGLIVRPTHNGWEITGNREKLKSFLLKYYNKDQLEMIYDSVQDDYYGNIEESKLRQSKDFKLKEYFNELDRLKQLPMSINKENSVHEIKNKIIARVKELKNVSNDIYDDSDINSTIDALIADEEEAIKGYEKAMENADEKHKALYSHIITEELEHIEELKNMKELNMKKDSIKDSTWLCKNWPTDSEDKQQLQRKLRSFGLDKIMKGEDALIFGRREAIQKFMGWLGFGPYKYSEIQDSIKDDNEFEYKGVKVIKSPYGYKFIINGKQYEVSSDKEAIELINSSKPEVSNMTRLYRVWFYNSIYKSCYVDIRAKSKEEAARIVKNQWPQEFRKLDYVDVLDSIKDSKSTNILISGDFKIVDNDVYYKNQLIKECSSIDSAKHYINHYKKEHNIK